MFWPTTLLTSVSASDSRPDGRWFGFKQERQETDDVFASLLLAALVTQSGALRFTAPPAWTPRPSTSPMRVAEFVVPRVAGDAEDAETIGTNGDFDRFVKSLRFDQRTPRSGHVEAVNDRRPPSHIPRSG